VDALKSRFLFSGSWRKIRDTTEFGVEFGYESGQLTALIVKGTGKANLKITMEWTKE
jgi:hypothetical protein